MKITCLPLILFCLLLVSCSSHFSRLNGNDVILYLDKPDAQKVEFFSSLNGYHGQELGRQNDLWEVRLPADKAFKYFYKIDGAIYVPACEMTETDDFGMENCIFEPKL